MQPGYHIFKIKHSEAPKDQIHTVAPMQYSLVTFKMRLVKMADWLEGLIPAVVVWGFMVYTVRKIEREHREYRQRVDENWQKREAEHRARVESLEGKIEILRGDLTNPFYMRDYFDIYTAVRKDAERQEASREFSFFSLERFDAAFFRACPVGSDVMLTIREIAEGKGGLYSALIDRRYRCPEWPVSKEQKNT